MQETNEKRMSDQVYRTIQTRILNHNLRPGEVIMAQRLAQDLQVSRTPIREALMRLVQEELIIPVTGGKYKVSEFPLSKILELYEIRKALEGYAGDVAARVIRPAQVKTFQRYRVLMEEAMARKDVEAYLQHDTAFHNLLLSLCGNDSLLQCVEKINIRTQRICYITMQINPMADKYIADHADIVNGLIRGDREQARIACERHQDRAIQHLQELVYQEGQNFLELRWLIEETSN
jgi:DNA-binding GntR family transcriptional regulator